MHEEIGGGFMEACIGAGEGLEPADQLVLLKNFIRALALRQGRCVTFMPRWTEDADSQSIHLHISLKDKRGQTDLLRRRRRRTASARPSAISSAGCSATSAT